MTRAVVTCMHRYQPYGEEYYAPILDFYLQNMRKYRDEYDHLYLVDSNWNIPESPDYKVLKVNPHLRYYDAYKEVLPQIKEDLVLFLDNDVVIYRKYKIHLTFVPIESKLRDVVAIYDTIGEKHFPELGGQSKFCLYWFASRKETLMKYLDVDWGQAPWGETLSYLTEAMLKDGLKPYEQEEDKSSIYFDGTSDGEHSKDLGYYHIRAGSVPALLLAYKKHDLEKYWEYLKNQPKKEYLRQLCWYWHMTDGKLDYEIFEILDDTIIDRYTWRNYQQKFKEYHGL